MALSHEERLRIDLAATFRVIAHLGMHEAVANHFSAAVSADGKRFLINPKWKHFSRIRASDLLLLDAEDPQGAERPDVDRTAWSIHGQIHRLLPEARVVLHLHPVYTTAVACLAKPEVPPIDQNTARYFNRLAVDELYGGMADTEAEGARLAGLLDGKQRLLMGNHGVMVIAPTIGQVHRPAAQGAVRRGRRKDRPRLGRHHRLLRAALRRDERTDDPAGPLRTGLIAAEPQRSAFLLLR